MPENVGPVHWINGIVGTCLLTMALITSVPLFFVMYYDGFASIFDMPALFDWLSAFAALFLVAGIYLLATPQRVGGWLNFREGGFSIRIRNFVLKDQDHDVIWSNVQRIELVKAARNNDGLTITLTRGEPVSFQTGHFAYGVDEILSRLFASAEAANYRLEKVDSFNAVIIEKRTWKVIAKS